MQNIAAHRLSELIGNIYDCAIDPDLWPEAMREICVELRCIGSVLMIADLQHSQPRFLRSWNCDDKTISQDKGYKEDVMFFLRQVATLALPVDQPAATSRILRHLPMYGTRYGQQVAKPRGEVDSLQTIVLRDASRLGLFAAIRHESVGLASDDDLALLRLFAPHIRRAITVSDLINLKNLEVAALSATLGRLTTGVMVVTNENRILHANESAREMLSARKAIFSRNGRLTVHDSAAEKELTRAIEIARRDESTLAAAGIGILLGAAEEAAVAHVLPLAHGALRTRLVPQATAAVFVTIPQAPSGLDFGVLGRAYELTPAEFRVCECLNSGLSPNEVAAELGVSISTVKTHMSRIFSKTGVSRQVDLVALLHRITPPIRRIPSQ